MNAGTIGEAAALFAITNIDDIVVLPLSFAQCAGHSGSARQIVAGQYLGLTAILVGRGRRRLQRHLLAQVGHSLPGAADRPRPESRLAGVEGASAAPAAPLARRTRQAQPWRGPPGAQIKVAHTSRSQVPRVAVLPSPPDYPARSHRARPPCERRFAMASPASTRRPLAKIRSAAGGLDALKDSELPGSDCHDELLIVVLVLVGVALAEVGDRFVERIAVAEVLGDGDRVTGPGMGAR